jgi:hypothetical protein
VGVTVGHAGCAGIAVSAERYARTIPSALSPSTKAAIIRSHNLRNTI